MAIKRKQSSKKSSQAKTTRKKRTSKPNPAGGSPPPANGKQSKPTGQTSVRAKKLYDGIVKSGEKIAFEDHDMPSGYIFVPKGDVYVTRNCRTRTKAENKDIYVVCHRKEPKSLGIRIPATILETVEADAAATASKRENAVKVKDERDITKARVMLEATFPEMPASSLETVLDHAFLKGSGRVGRSTKQTPEHKASLAVEAHIRHTQTDYDELLLTMDRDDARKRVWQDVQDIKAKWSGGKKLVSLPVRKKKK
ncbi:hypothetical protein FQN54_001314 [Arachnomyces sp. PD_36]|nr:hypothetical protein FQN54_001314 [Arachnomyces sp. PD_36]